MPQPSKNTKTDFLGQIFRELFQLKTRSILLGHPVCPSPFHISDHGFRSAKLLTVVKTDG